MIRLIINIVTLVVLAVFIAMNVSYETSINLFGFKYDNISTVAVIIISLVSGVLYSFFYYLLTYISKSEKLKIRNKNKQTKLKEKELKTKEKNIHKAIEEGVKDSIPNNTDPVELELAAVGKKKKIPLKLFKGKKNN
ncbi:MAG: hypothetical protein DRP58_01345 [Spirochaetes bacterium]|nr:MAG: hypothetical protein DRP58_01345 [Spirochaetota bacterium]